MGLVGNVSMISKAGQPKIYNDQILAVGNNKVYLFGESDVASLDLYTGATATTAHSIDVATYWNLVSSGISKSGYVDFKAIHTKAAEEEGSRNLFMTHARIDILTLEIVSSSTTQLTGPALDEGPFYGVPISITRGDYLVTSEMNKGQLTIVNLNNLTYWLSDLATAEDYYMLPRTVLVDRTTHKPYIFFAQHYWIVGNYTRCGLYDPATDTMTDSTSFNVNSGAIHYGSSLYEGSDKKTHFIYTGISHAGELGSRYSKYYLMYVDNGTLTSEIDAVGGAAYTSGTCADIAPFVLGITEDDTLALATLGQRGTYVSDDSPAFTAAVDLIECSNLLASPSKISIVTDIVDENTNHVRFPPPYSAYLLEKDWTYRIPMHMYPFNVSANTGTMKIAKIDLTSDVTPNPNVLVVPT